MRMRSLGILLSLCTLGSSPACASFHEVAKMRGAPEQTQDLIGKKVIVTFRWTHPTSIRQGLMIRGRLAKADARVLVLSDEGEMSKGTLPDVLARLQEYGKVSVHEGPPRLFVIERADVADVFCASAQDCWSTRDDGGVEE